MPRYNPATIEPKWQRYWEENRTFAAPRLPSGDKLYVLDMFPYPSGEGLHVGHPEGQTATDIICRYQRMRGKCVLHPMGWDAFGLPAEQHAIRTGTPPRITTEKNIATFRRQEKMLGFSYDWDRELSTTDVEYFRWTQWIFLVLFDTFFDEKSGKGRPIAELAIPDAISAAGEEPVRRYRDEHRLAYQLEAPVNWCPALGTVLANEEVIGGLSERGSHPVVRIPLRQWMLRITAYADRLERDLSSVDWPESIQSLQRNWIGKSVGAEVDFFIGPRAALDEGPSEHEVQAWRRARAESGFPRKPESDVLRVFTTRPDTLFGATYMVLAPEHPAVERLSTPAEQNAVRSYAEQASRKSDMDRTDLAKDKTGVFTGSYAVNPVNGERVPIWVADYVLMGYGTGAIMAVPAHDIRDFEFARAHGLPIRAVVDPGDSTGPGGPSRADVLAGREASAQAGVAIASGPYDGLTTDDFKQRIIADQARQGVGREAINYKLRDWLFSRQHFWGEPFPILHELDEHDQPTGLLRAIDADELPVDLPDLKDFRPHGRPEPPLEQAPREWLYPIIDGKKYKRETNTMPQWAGSCWYYLRFLDPRNNAALVDPVVERAWMPVDIYIGGAEHAVLHLLYARFWHKVLFDRGLVSTPEPFRKLVNQGMILGEIEFTGYQQPGGGWVSAETVDANADGGPVLRDSRANLQADVQGVRVERVRVEPHRAVKQGEAFVLADEPTIRLESRAHKMAKSRGNVVNPDAVVAEYGADSLRLFEMFMGPLEAVKPWSTEGVNGVRGFLDRVWRMTVDERGESPVLHSLVKDFPPTAEQNRMLHKTIQGVTQDIERMAFNTAIAKMMEFTNYFLKADVRPRHAMEQLILILSPFAPHLAEELWQLLGHGQTLAYEAWPAFDESLIREDTIEVPVQINGKVRGRIMVPADAKREHLEAAAREEPRIAELLRGKQVAKVVVVPGRMVNFVLAP